MFEKSASRKKTCESMSSSLVLAVNSEHSWSMNTSHLARVTLVQQSGSG